MAKTISPAPTSSSQNKREDLKPQNSNHDNNGGNFSRATIGMAITMAWQLVFVVLIPVIGGHYLDETFDTSPKLTTVGAVIATIGMVLVVRQTVREINRYMNKYMEENKHD